MSTNLKTGDFFSNVSSALESNHVRALRLDQLADMIEPVTSDNSHRWRVFDKLKAGETFEAQGLGDINYELISAREQDGYGFSQDEFPKVEMGERPGTKKRTRKAREAVSDASGVEEAKVTRNYWPIVTIKDPNRAALKSDLANLADEVFNLVKAKYSGRFDVVAGSKSFTVQISSNKFAGFDSDE